MLMCEVQLHTCMYEIISYIHVYSFLFNLDMYAAVWILDSIYTHDWYSAVCVYTIIILCVPGVYIQTMLSKH